MSTVPLELLFNDNVLSSATAFCWKAGDDILLMTNWHNVTGRNPETNQLLSPAGGIPNRTRVWWNVEGKLGNKVAAEYALLDAQGEPLWFVHPELGRAIDVVALIVVPPDEAEPYAINMQDEEQMLIRIGMDVFVLGYPLGPETQGLPVWKRASIASEPELELNPARRCFLVDTATRPGMSGAPVIRRSWGNLLTESGMKLGGASGTRFIGVYSGRMPSQNLIDAQLGLVWPTHRVTEIVAARHREE